MIRTIWNLLLDLLDRALTLDDTPESKAALISKSARAETEASWQ